MRKEVDITIDAEGRDQGKTYRIKELSASEAEEWAIRAFMGAARAGIQLPDNIKEMGLAGIAMLGVRALAGMSFDDAKPLLDKMFSCVSFVSSKGIVRALAEGDIEEVATRFRLRKEIIEVHSGFFSAAEKLKSEREAAQAKSASQNTPTSLSDSQP